MPKTVAIIIGSLRNGSLNRKLAHSLEKLAEGKLIFDYVEIGDLPHYNEDLWESTPAPVTRFKGQIDATDAILLVTPEYNRSYPGVVKNALDWGSRPKGDNSWSGKPAAVAGTSPGATGSAVGQSQARLQMLMMNMIVMHQPEFYLQWKAENFGQDGSVTSDDTRKFLQKFIDQFADFIGQHEKSTHREAVRPERLQVASS